MTAMQEARIAAAAGGIAPSVVSLAVELTGKKNPELPPFTFYVGVVLFAVMGYLVALFWKEKVAKTAFFLGVGLPALLQVGVLSRDKPGDPTLIEPRSSVVERRSDSSFFIHLSTTLWAQEAPNLPTPTEPNLATKRRLVLAFDSVPSDTQVVFITSRGEQRVAVNWTDAARTGAAAIAIPRGATQVRLLSTLTRNTPVVTLPRVGTPTFKLDTETDLTAGFLRAFGVKANDRLTITKVDDDGTSLPIKSDT